MNEYLLEKNTQLKVQPEDYIEEYLEFLKEYKIEYRDKINVPKEYTFGIEIEYENYSESQFAKRILEYYKNIFNSKTELDMVNGGEVTSKVMNDRSYCWKNIKYILNELKKVGAESRDNCGSHVHVGAHVLGDNIKNWKKLLYLYTVYELVIYRFASGEYLNVRPRINAKAYPISIDLANLLEKIESASEVEDLKTILECEDRYRGLNFKNVDYKHTGELEQGNTLEFRMANGTHDAVIWQNLVNFYLKLLYASVNKDIDLDYLKYRIKLIQELTYYKNYNRLYLDDAFELADIIFDNDLDKTNFLKQYYKDGREVNAPNLVKSEKITR
jgi:hypothetical protein